MVSRLEEVKDLRKIWSNESRDFTPWLAKDENMEILSDEIGIDIEVEEIESSVGDFSVDILANEQGFGRKIIIENQLESTDHDHLGKLITYASGKSANIIIWIVKHAREEHKAAVEWLNRHTDNDIGFFLCEIKLYCIGDSEPAVKFEVVEKPNDWAKEIKKNDSLSENSQRKLEYWTAFNDYAYKDNQFSKVYKPRKPSTDHWMDFAIGSSGCHLTVDQIYKNDCLMVELYIREDKELFRSLYSRKDSIEGALNMKFDWRELPNRKASRIIRMRDADLNDRNQWPEQFDWIMDSLLRMRAEFKKYI